MPKALAALAVLILCAAASAETRTADLCMAIPRVDAERALGVKIFGSDVLDDRLGPYRRRICRLQTEPGETIELTVWSRIDGRAFAPLPNRAESCDVGCLAAGREPNLYTYEQKRIGTALCVTRRPRTDRDLATGPITACTLGGPRRLMLSVSRKQGLAAATMETVKTLLDRASSAAR